MRSKISQRPPRDLPSPQVHTVHRAVHAWGGAGARAPCTKSYIAFV